MLSFRSQLRPGARAINNVAQTPSRGFMNVRTVKSAELEHNSWKDVSHLYG